MTALASARRAGLMTRENVTKDIIAGIIVGLVALPLALAFAIASGVRPEQGLYTAIIAGTLVAIFGGSRFQIAGPTGAFIIILSGVVAKYGVEGLQIATLMAGGILILLGLARLGSIIKFIPSPVIVGFTSGIGIIIFVGQWQSFFGLPDAAGDHFHEKIMHLVQSLPGLHPATSLLSFVSLTALLVSARYIKKIPAPLIAIGVATLLQYLFHFEGVATIGSAFGELPQTLPLPEIPDITWDTAIKLIRPAFAIAMLGAIESLLSAVVADGMTGTRHDSNQELIGQGIANMVAPLFGGIAATGAIARTATSIRSGAVTPLAGIAHAVTLLLIILFLAPIASLIPLGALAAVLFVVAYNMSDMPHFLSILRGAPRNDVIVLLITFFLTVFVDLALAVNVGIIIASLMFMKRMAQSVRVDLHSEADISKDLGYLAQMDMGVLVYAIEGPFFFGAAEVFERTIAHIHGDPEILILRLGHVPFIDITGIETLKDVIAKFKSRNVRVICCEATSKVQKKLHKSGFIDLVGPENVFPSLEAAIASSKVRR